MERPLDRSAVLLPSQRRSRSSSPVPWARILVAFLFVVASGCAIVLLALSWHNELNRRQEAQGSAASSLKALQTTQDKLSIMQAHDRVLTDRVEVLERRLEDARHDAARGRQTVKGTNSVLRTTRAFVVALDGLDEVLSDVVAADGDLGTAKRKLARHVDGLSTYLRQNKNKLDPTILTARTRLLVADVAAIEAIVVKLAGAKDDLVGAGKPLEQTDELEAALKAALARGSAALKR
jgi:hypothetical protein